MKNGNNINTPVEEKSMSVASLILGIVSIIDAFFPYIPNNYFIWATLAIIFGILGKKKRGSPHGYSRHYLSTNFNFMFFNL